jgi:hypothetical protein
MAEVASMESGCWRRCDGTAKSVQEVGAVKARVGVFQRKENKERDLIPWETYRKVKRGSSGTLGSFKHGEGLHENRS